MGLLEKAGEAPWEKWQPEYASRFLDATHEAQPLRLVLPDLVGVRKDEIPVYRTWVSADRRRAALATRMGTGLTFATRLKVSYKTRIRS